MSDIESWPRPYFEREGGMPFLFYVVFGAGVDELQVSRSGHRFGGLPEGLEVMGYGPEMHPEVLDGFRSGPLWDEVLTTQPALARAVAAQTRCVIVRGSIEDDESLDYFRDAIGLLTALLDAGGVAIFDAHVLRWWSPPGWRGEIFEPAVAQPHKHVVILFSEEDDGSTWLHTRGLLKFGRPDLSMHDVMQDHFDTVVDLFNRFIEFQALGGVIVDGHDVNVPSLPAPVRCVHGGDEDDPDFNNRHVEFQWVVDEPAGEGPPENS
jgi:hypothetical protein